ncbi:hypothetical protein [Mesorhizobium sp. NZP2077]|uniref:hypothetical protein n=1 Tax=Mesorhizobium sp. NZP2077 TaxID=2483404 RepID=UPI001553D887|nr:hypothetical protein [Mesorhizobium sp. NZP2077]QKD17962.1 hypothetical protein HGP13_24610 [Mesorhizobium sp. NZP2077]
MRFDANGGGALLAVVLEKLVGKNTYLVLSSNHQIPAFSILPIGYEHRCFSYGAEWVMELLPDEETFPGNAEGADSAGEIRLFDTGITSIIANMLDQRMNRKLILLNMISYRPANEERYQGARVRSWKIWANEEERLRTGGRPIFSFPQQQ